MKLIVQMDQFYNKCKSVYRYEVYTDPHNKIDYTTKMFSIILTYIVSLHKSLIQFICKRFTHLHILIHKENYIFHWFDNIMEYLEKYRCQYGLFRNGIPIMTWLKLNSYHFDRLFTTLIRQTGISRSWQPRRMVVEREPLSSFMSQHNGFLLWIGLVYTVRE